MPRLAKAAVSIAAVAALGFGLMPAVASANETTWNVDPGGRWTGTATGVHTALVDPATGQVRSSVTCGESEISGELSSGPGNPGRKIGTIDTIAFRNCDGPAGLIITINAGGIPWFMNAESYDPSIDTAGGTVTSDSPDGVHADLSISDGCELEIRGKDGGAGQLEWDYGNGDGLLSIGGGNLAVADWNGGIPEGPCDEDLVRLGDEISITGEYAVTPHQTIRPT